eukprot:4405881-Pleurochrysis_carterae.AAC.2
MKQNKQMRSGKLAVSSVPANACSQTANNFMLHPNTRDHSATCVCLCMTCAYQRTVKQANRIEHSPHRL